MSGQKLINRRSVLAGGASMLAAPYIIRPSFAQAKGEIIQCNFGGGVATAFQKSYGDTFTAKTGIPFRIVEVPSTETALISNASKPIYNSSYHSYSGAMNLYRQGITEPLAIADYPILQEVPQNLLPMVDDKHVAGMPIQFIFYGIAHNKDLSKRNDFKSWHGLVDPKWKGQISFTQPVFASLYDVPWYSKMLTGDQKQLDAGIKHYRKVADNALAAYTSMAQNQQLLERGDVVASAYYSSRIWDLKVSGVANVDIILPDEGALMIPYVFVIPKNAPHIEAARKFAAFAGTAEPQEITLEVTGTFPTNKSAKINNDMIKSRLGVTRDEIIEKAFNPDWAYIHEQREDLVKRLEAALR